MLGVSLDKRDISDIINFFQEFSILLRARHPILYIVTDDEERVEYVLEYGAKKKLREPLISGTMPMDIKETYVIRVLLRIILAQR